MSTTKVMGRVFDHRTMEWVFPDGSGVAMPDELMPQANPVTGCALIVDLFEYMSARDQRAAAKTRSNHG